MKNIFSLSTLALIFLLISNSLTYSQSFAIDKGSKIIGGSFTFSSSGGGLHENSEGDNLLSIGLNGTFGYFLSPGLCIGGNILFNHRSQGEYSNNQFGIGPKFSYFFGESEKSFYPYLTTSILYLTSKYKDSYTYMGETESWEYTTSGYEIYAAGGVCFMLSNTIGLFSEAGYQYEKVKYDEVSESGNCISITFGVNAFLF